MITIKEARKKAKLTQEETSRALNMTQVTYNKKENNKAKWIYEEILKFCELVNEEITNIDFRKKEEK